MLVDSLRADFISNPKSGFSFVRSLLSQGQAFTYKAHAHPPTVTLPRVKALVTGGIPSFSDYLNNFQSSALDQDNIVWQMQRHSKCIVFYGDDTWLKLFPDSFTRHDGTTSFFVTDTVIVDNNVTRHLDPELQRFSSSKARSQSLTDMGNSRRAHGAEKSYDSSRNGVSSLGSSKRNAETSHLLETPPESATRTVCDANADWDVMILHYLGLDHVGHLEGPRSPLMYPKQVEMNGVFEMLYNAIDEDTLLVMSGDHGMNEDGAHGGPSSGETSPALVLASPAFSNSRADRTTSSMSIDQIDLVPTLSTLIGIPTPLNSVGKLIPDVVQHLYGNNPSDMLRAYQLNALQIHRLLKTSAAICEGGNIKQYHDPSPCVGVIEDARKAVSELTEAKTAHREFADSGDEKDLERALNSYRTFLDTSSYLFARALSEYDDYLLISSIIGFAIAALFATASFSSPLKHHPPPLLILICAVSHFLIDTVMLAVMGSNLATIGGRICVSLLMGYCLAHLALCAKLLVNSYSSFVSSYSSSPSNGMQFYWKEKDRLWKMVESRSSAFVVDWFTAPADQNNGRFIGFVLLVGLVIRPLVYSSSSFIEEEHLTFFYMCCTSVFALLHYTIMQSSGEYTSIATVGVVLAAMRTCRLWNQTGFQGIGMPDVAQLLNGPHTTFRNALVILSFASLLAYVAFQVVNLLKRSSHSSSSSGLGSLLLKKVPFDVPRVSLQAWMVCWSLGLLATFLFQLTGSHYWAYLARYGFLLSFLLSLVWLIVNTSTDAASISDCLLLVFWTIFGLCLLMCRYHNVPLLALWILQAHGMLKLSQGFSPASSKFVDVAKDWIGVLSDDSSSRVSAIRLPFWIWSLVMFNLGQYAYFSQGNSNSLASIDIAGAYAGLSGYQDSLVGLFVTILLYSGPLTFQFTLLLIFLHQDHGAVTGTTITSTSNSLLPTQLSASPAAANLQQGRLLLEQPVHLSLFESLKIRLLGRSWSLVIYAIFITLHRGHLFIWSVFAPKLLYECFHSIAFFLQTVTYFTFALTYSFYSKNVPPSQSQGHTTNRRERGGIQEVRHVHPHHAHEEPFTSHHAAVHHYQPNFVIPTQQEAPRPHNGEAPRFPKVFSV